MEWMEEVDIKNWILPDQCLNKETRYENRVPGNAPEFNRVDINLHCDIYCAVLEHCSYTAQLAQADKQKFSVSTPLRQD
eukprot:2864501-Ditylum_brightwellii.AAC.1